MTTKASEVIADALQLIMVQADEAPIEAVVAQSAIRALNRMMNRFAADGINLGFTEVETLASEITVADGAIDGIISNLAKTLAPQFSSTGVPGAVMQMAEDGMQTMINIAVVTTATEYPPTLPYGSGQDLPGCSTGHFYPDLESTILSETNGSISLEDET